MPKTNGAGSIYLRGNIWWVQVYIDGKPILQSSKSSRKSDAVKLRNQLLAKKERGEISGGSPDRVLVSELLDDVLKSDIKESTRYIWEKVIEKNIRPFFGRLKARRVSTDLMDRYREKRKDEGALRRPSTASFPFCERLTTTHGGERRQRWRLCRIFRWSRKPPCGKVS